MPSNEADAFIMSSYFLTMHRLFHYYFFREEFTKSVVSWGLRDIMFYNEDYSCLNFNGIIALEHNIHRFQDIGKEIIVKRFNKKEMFLGLIHIRSFQDIVIHKSVNFDWSEV
jgi:hypothetical protein